jgi:formylglycine-generating enzyme required for sulfatase activity
MLWVAAMVSSPTGETPHEKTYPFWDGKESVADYAKRSELESALTLDLGDGVTMEFVLIPAGKLRMVPTPKEGFQFKYEGQQHDVTIATPFYIGKFEVTQEQYEKLIKKNPSQFFGLKNPVECVSWNDAHDFCKKLGQKTGRSVRLPSEAEWEYACRAGSKPQLLPVDAAWFKVNSESKTHPVGGKAPNALGLYDMHGNVWEWCEDDWHLVGMLT